MAKSSFKNQRHKFQRSTHLELQGDILKSQISDANGDLADSLLICDGGSIRVHTFILQAASPFIQDAIASQGENYPYIREIIIPDFSITAIEKMISLIYKGYANLDNDKEVQSLQDTLNFFQVSGVDYCNEDNQDEQITGSLKIHNLNRIPQDIFKQEIKQDDDQQDRISKVVAMVGGSSSKEGTTSPSRPVSAVKDSKKRGAQTEEFARVGDQQQLRRSTRAPKPIAKVVNNATRKDDPDYKTDSENESSAEEASSGEKDIPRKRARPVTIVKQPVLKLPRLVNPSGKNRTVTASSVPSSPTRPLVSSSSSRLVQAVKNQGPASEEQKKEDSGTDSEDQDWEQPNFKDKQWFHDESRRCQYCSKSFEDPPKASLCVTSHKCLRCYFCFKVFSTTDILFKHFKRRHKQAGRDSTLICPFCDQSVPYKSVSCHVISTHLTNKSKVMNGKPGNSTAVNAPGRLATTAVVGKSSVAGTSRSRPESAERSICERNPSKKIRTFRSPEKKDKNKTLKMECQANLKKKDLNETRALKIPDMNLKLQKRRVFGKIITFKLQKKRLDANYDA